MVFTCSIKFKINSRGVVPNISRNSKSFSSIADSHSAKEISRANGLLLVTSNICLKLEDCTCLATVLHLVFNFIDLGLVPKCFVVMLMLRSYQIFCAIQFTCSSATKNGALKVDIIFSDLGFDIQSGTFIMNFQGIENWCS